MERVVVHLANGLSSRGIPTMTVCLENPGEIAFEIEKQNIRAEALYSRSSKDFISLWRLRNLLMDFKPTIMNIHDYACTPYAVTAKWLGRKTPTVFTAHGLLYDGFEGLKQRYRFFSKGFAKLVAVTEAVADRHRKYLDWQGDIPIIQNGVPAIHKNAFVRHKIRSELGINDKDILFLAVGNPRPEKGFEILIDATAALKKMTATKHQFTVAIAGKLTESQYCRMLKNRVKEKNVEHCCRFLGFRKDINALYSAADAFILSSRSEGLPMVVLEAMMAGLPVVATRVGGVPNAVRNHGLLVAVEDPLELAHAMMRLLSDNNLADKLGRAGMIHAQSTYGMDHMVEQYISCFHNLLENDKKRQGKKSLSRWKSVIK